MVLKLLFNLVDRKYPLGRGDRNVYKLKADLQHRLEELYPDRETHLVEAERQGYIPPEVEKQIRSYKGIQNIPSATESEIFDKHATPAPPPGELSVILEQLRPSVVLGDSDSALIEDPSRREPLALQQLALASGSTSLLRAQTGVDLVDQWNWNFLQLAFPYSIPRVVGGADFPLQKRPRRQEEGAILDPWDHLGMHARRVDSNLKTDWTLMPSQRNITTKWDALCGDRVACKHQVDPEKAGLVF